MRVRAPSFTPGLAILAVALAGGFAACGGKGSTSDADGAASASDDSPALG